MDCAELDLTIHPSGAHYAADLRLRATNGVVSVMTHNAPTSIEPNALIALSLDPEDYGRALTEQVFASATLREAWARIEGFAQGGNTCLRLRLHIAPGAEALHELRWETLRSPITGQPLARGERIVFSRFFDSPELNQLNAPILGQGRVLVAVASPSDLEQFGLAPIQVADEVTRITAAFADVPVTLLTSRPYGTGLTLNGLIAGLRAAPSILYLVCHGTMLEGQPFLWLENDEGKVQRVPGDLFVERFGGLPDSCRPLFIVLAMCRSAGSPGQFSALTALGPKLMRAGTGAVLGMMGDAPFQLVERLMPRFLTLLREDGCVDRALSIARDEISEEAGWWMPVLYMRVPEGRLWNIGPDTSLQRVAGGIDALRQLLREPAVRELVTGSEGQIIAARAQVSDLIALKELHDQLHLLQFQCYNPLFNDVMSRFPAEDSAVESGFNYQLNLEKCIRRIQAIVAKAPDIIGDMRWLHDLESANQMLQNAVDALDLSFLRRALALINRVLALQPSYINANLIARARTLRLYDLANTMERLQAKFIGLAVDPRHLAHFKAGVTALNELAQEFAIQIATHDAWQALDREARRVEEMTKHNTDELEFSWSTMSQRISELAASSEEWASTMRVIVAQLDAALSASFSEQFEKRFRRLHRLIGERFFQVDVDLVQLCTRLRELRDPLDDLQQEFG